MATITSAFVCANPNTKIFKTKMFFCYLSNPNKFQISCQGIDLRRQKSFNFLKKYFKSKQKYLIWKWVKINELMWLSISTKVLDCFSPKKWHMILFTCSIWSGYSVHVRWHSALLAQQAWMMSPYETKKLWITHDCTHP